MKIENKGKFGLGERDYEKEKTNVVCMPCRTCICISVLQKLILVLVQDQNFRYFPNTLIAIKCS